MLFMSIVVEQQQSCVISLNPAKITTAGLIPTNSGGAKKASWITK